MSPNTIPDDIWIEYDSRGGRARKHFTDKFAARRFWAAKDRDGKSPRVVKQRPRLEPVGSLAELGANAATNPRYAQLALIAARNLGGGVFERVQDAIEWLEMNAAECELEEFGEGDVVDEINALRDIEAEGGSQ
jgi:hypothetical protein